MREILNAPKREIKCAKCGDTGLPPNTQVRYTPYGVPIATFVDGYRDLGIAPACDCEAGQRWLADQERAKQAAEKERAESHARRVEWCRNHSRVPSRMQAWRLETYPGSPDLVSVGQAFIAGRGTIADGGKQKVGILLMGATGVGKTGLAVAILNEWTANAHVGLFWEVGSFLRAIRATFAGKAPETTEQVTQPARECELLVLDDIGDVGRGGNPTSDFTREEIFDLVNFRYNEQKPTIFTSNLTVKQMVEQFGERTWWRVADMCMVVEVGGKNLRA